MIVVVVLITVNTYSLHNLFNPVHSLTTISVFNFQQFLLDSLSSHSKLERACDIM